MNEAPKSPDTELNDKLLTEYKDNEQYKPENERMNRLKSEYRDYVYNLMFSDKITIHE